MDQARPSISFEKNAFHRREISIYSGDALRCEVEFAFVYDEQGTLIDQKIAVTKVLEVIRGSGPQTDLFDREKT
jgi:hypothetical protein